MLNVIVVMCGWCRSPRPLEIQGIDDLPPGAHMGKISLSHGICIPCGTKFSDMIEKGGATPNVTPVRDNATEGKKKGS